MVLEVAARAPEQRGGGQGNLAQLVAPQPRVARPEIGQQRDQVAHEAVVRVAAQRPHLDTGVRDAGVEPGRQHVHADQHRDRGCGRRVDARVDEGEVEGQQAARHRVAHQLAAQHDAENDRGDGEALDPAVGLDQLRGRQQFGEDAVLGRRIRRRAQAHDRVGHQRVTAEEHHQAAHDLDRVADEHHLALGQGVGEGAHQRRQRDVEDGEDGHQRRALPFRGSCGAQQFDGSNEKRLVGQRREELRRHDGVETALHR